MAIEFKEELFGTPRRLLMDPVHGGIPLFDHEAKVIDHPLFQRLRYIIQNDITSLVFPGACHSRFLHSLGAMHIAGRFYKSLVRSYLTDKNRKISDQVSVEEKDAIRYFYFCLRLAALLHDTGHFPFSHQLESSEQFKKLLRDEEIFNTLWPDQDIRQSFYPVSPISFSHEHFSVRCAHKILSDVANELDFNVDPFDVLAIMETSECKPSSKFIDHSCSALGLFLRDKKALDNLPKEKISDNLRKFFKTIISGEIDIDKMDYLLRDSFFSGCRYGIYNLDHLLSTFRIGFDLNSFIPWVGIAITKKGIGPLEDFIYSRFQLYQELYNHKTLVGFKWLLQVTLDELIDNELLLDIKKHLIKCEEFIDFTDSYFWEKIRAFAKNNPNSAASHLMRRKKLEHIISGINIENFKITEIENKIGKQVISKSSPIKFSGIKNAFEDIRVLVRDPITNTRKLDAIREHTSFFSKFENVEIKHIFIKPDFQCK